MTSTTATPRLGLGIDYKNVDAWGYPGGLRALVRDFSSRVSHLQVISAPAEDDLADWRAMVGDLPVLHHMTNIQPTRPEGPDLAIFEDQDARADRIGALWQYEDLGYWTLGPYNAPYFAPPILDREVADHTVRWIRHLTARSRVPFAPENPTCTFVAGSLSLGEFFKRVVGESGTPMILDLAHMYSYARLCDRDPVEVLRSMPLDAVWELHVAGGYVDPEHSFRYMDSHRDPIVDDVIALLEVASRECPNLRAVTYEITARLPPDILARDFQRLQDTLDAADFTPSLAA